MERFSPFKADPSKDVKENAIAFLNWLVQSHVILHEHQMRQAQYLRTMYEMLWNAGLRSGQPQAAQSRPQAPPGLPTEALLQGLDWMKQNSEVFRSIFDLLRPKV